MAVQLIILPENTAVLSPERAKEFEIEILKVWKNRAYHLSLNPKHKKTKEFQVEFLVGAYAALDQLGKLPTSSITPRIAFSIMRGDYIEVPEEVFNKNYNI
jgi:hypothetical protein